MSTLDNLQKAEGNEEQKIETIENTSAEETTAKAEEITVADKHANEDTVTPLAEDQNASTLENTTSEQTEKVENSVSKKKLSEQETTKSSGSNELPEPSKTPKEPEENTEENKEASMDQDIVVSADQKADHVQKEMEDAVAEHSEDESTSERHDIEKKDYHSMSKEELIKELRKLVKNEKVQAIKEHVEEIKVEFNAKFNEEVEQKKEEFLAEGGNIIDFYYSTPLKKEFNSVYFDYKEKRNTYYQNLKRDLQANLQKRLELIEELKGLLNMEESINSTYEHFKEIKEKWHNAGPIPRDKYNTVWNTYHHHVENFYDFLHLNRDFRDMDFKHNLEQKLKIIERATELAQETDVNRAFRELQILHKMWKEDLGPVEKQYRDQIWEKFSELTKKIHENRQHYFKELDKIYEKNLVVKQDIIAKIIEVGSDHPNSHGGWQQKIKEIEALREEFFKAGKVPSHVNEETWGQFKSAVRDFNRHKNAFYKGLKKNQFENLHKKMELIKIAEDNKDSEDFSVTTPLMKKIQADWKKIGHVPRKDSDKIWKRFKDACNFYFDRVHAERNQSNKEELEAYEKKVQHLEDLKTLKLSGNPKDDLTVIKEHISKWKDLGRVPYNKRSIDNDYNKILDSLFTQLSLDRKQAEMIKYENKLSSLSDQSDDRALNNEQSFIRKKIDEVKGEIRQLENNLLFFKHAKDDNPMVMEVKKNIEKHKESLDLWKAKLKKIKQL